MKYDYSITLTEPQSLYCPIIKAEMSIISQEVSELGPFSKLLIWAVGNGYNPVQIVEITNLSPVVVEEEINYLIKIGLLNSTDRNLELAELGYSYFKKIEVVDGFNSHKIQVLINCVSGEILEDSLDLVENHQLNSHECVLSQRIIPELYGNLNPSNSKDFLLEKYDLFPLSQEEKSLLDVAFKLQLKKEKEKQQFLRYEIQKVPFLLHKEVVNSIDYDSLTPRKETTRYTETHSLLPFMYPVQKGKLIISNLYLDPYRNVLHTLEKIEQFNRELISDKSKSLLELYKHEQELQRKLDVCIYFDSVSGIITRSLNPEHRIERNIRNEVQVPSNYKLEKLLSDDFLNIIKNLTGEEVEDTSWNLTFVLEEEFYLKVNDNPIGVLVTN